MTNNHFLIAGALFFSLCDSKNIDNFIKTLYIVFSWFIK